MVQKSIALCVYGCLQRRFDSSFDFLEKGNSSQNIKHAIRKEDGIWTMSSLRI